MVKRMWIAMFLTVAIFGFGCDSSDGDGGDGQGSGGNTNDTTGGGGGNGGSGEGSCDPSKNPFAGTCVESFAQPCFQPSGECTATVTQDGANVEWASGHKVVTQGTSSTGSDGSGNTCYTGDTTVDVASQSSTTTYTASGKTYVFEASASGAMTVTCPDGSTLTVTAEQAKDASACSPGSYEGCEVDFGGGGNLPGGCTADSDCNGKKCCDVFGVKTCLDACL